MASAASDTASVANLLESSPKGFTPRCSLTASRWRWRERGGASAETPGASPSRERRWATTGSGTSSCAGKRPSFWNALSITRKASREAPLPRVVRSAKSISRRVGV